MRQFLKTAAVTLAAAAFILTTSIVLAGCNTVEGAGRDIEAAGDGISEGAREVRDDM